MVAHFVGDRFVQDAARLQLAYQTKGIVEHHQAVACVVGGAQVSKTLDAVSAIVAIDFRDHENVDVIVAIPSGQALDRGLVCSIVVLTVADAMLRVPRHAVSIDAYNAVGGRSIWRATRHFKLDKGVGSLAFVHAVTEVVVHAVNGGQDLCLADVFLHTHRRSTVNYVNHHRKGVHIHISIGRSLQTLNRGTHGVKVPGVGFRGGHFGGVKRVGRAGLSGLGRRKEARGEQGEDGKENTHEMEC